MNPLADDFVLQLACDRGLLRADQFEAARAVVAAHTDRSTPLCVFDVLVANGAIDRRRVAKLVADEFGMATVELGALRVPGDVLALVPRTLAVRHGLVPLARSGPTLRVAVSDPLDTDGPDSLAHLLNLTIEAVVAFPGEIPPAIERLYGASGPPPAELLGGSSIGECAVRLAAAPPVAAAAAISSPANGDADAPIIGLVHSVILGAIHRRASDIHLEPLEKRFRVRYRIDGVLIEVGNPPKRLQLAIVSRLKIMANISIAERRVPQDGRIQIVIGDRALDLRVSSLPTAHGESIVMRILDQAGLKLGLPELGFFRDDQVGFERLITRPDGMVLVTGPTGSGKTTTLYSCLHHLNRSDRKIITVEDPVEYQLSGINQVPVRPEVGLTFASALRAILRQAPNIVMIGEIRDLETAEIAINASLTGHLVFSTLHTNDAPGAVARLIDIGVKPFLVATALRVTLAQRLVRKICPQCRRPYEPTSSELRSLNLNPSCNPLGYTEAIGAGGLGRGAGCPECNGTGYRGRTGLFEVFPINEEIQRMIHENAGSARLRAKARALGMRTMREDGARKVLAGWTTIEEVVSLTVGDPS